MGEATADQVKKRIGQMLACFGCNQSQRKPPPENSPSFTSGGMFASLFTKGQCS